MNIVRSLMGTRSRPCPACGAPQTPMRGVEMTAHEFRCFKRDRAKIPPELRVLFQQTAARERHRFTVVDGGSVRRCD